VNGHRPEERFLVLKRLLRDPKIVWRIEKQREAQVLEAMEAGEETGEQGTVILIVAGTMHQLNYVGGMIWQLCDGERDANAIIDRLHVEFEVARDELATDVHAFIAELVEKGWLNYAE